MKYELNIWENDERISQQPLDDPFIHTTLTVKGWRAALALLRGKTLRFVITLGGDSETVRRVMRLNHEPELDPPVVGNLARVSEGAEYREVTP